MREEIFKSKVDALQWKLLSGKYNVIVRGELSKLMPNHHGVLFKNQDKAALLIQRVFRGSRVRIKYFIQLNESRRIRELKEKECNAAIRIQRQYRRVQSNVIMRTQRVVKRKKTRLAINLQRLYRKRKLKIMKVAREKLQVKRVQSINESRRFSAIKIQRTWNRYASGCGFGENNEATLLVKSLIRGHEALVQEEEELDKHARIIQALYRGRRDRLNLVGLKRNTITNRSSEISKLLQKLKQQSHHGLLSIGYITKTTLLAKNKWNLPYLFENQVIVSANKNLSSGQDFTRFTQALMNNRYVHTLIIPKGHIGSDGLLALAQALSKNKGIQVLAIGENQIGADSPWCNAIGLFSKCLKTVNYHLRELLIEDNPIEDTGALLLVDAVGDYFFARYGRLEKLVLARDCIGNLTCTQLGAALTISTRLKILDLSGNKISDEGATALAEGLMENTSLVELDLTNNKIGSDGGRSFANTLVVNKTLQKLRLGNNNLKNDVVKSFLEVFQEAESIQLSELELGGNLIHEENIAELSSFLRIPVVLEEPSAELRKSPKKRRKRTSKDWFEKQKEELLKSASIDSSKESEQVNQPQRILGPLSPKRLTAKSPINIIRPGRRERRDQPLSGITSSSKILKTPECIPAVLVDPNVQE